MILLRELFNKIFPYEKIRDWPEGAIYQFITSHQETYDVIFSRNQLRLLPMYDDYYFQNALKKYGYRETDDAVQIGFARVDKRDDYRYDLVDSEDFYGVFATVLAIIKKEVQSNDLVIFAAKEPSRVKLYDRLVSKFKRPGDRLEKVKGFQRGDTYYILIPAGGAGVPPSEV